VNARVIYGARIGFWLALVAVLVLFVAMWSGGAFGG
jgi:hypothetical protein